MALSGQASMQALQRVHRSRSIGLPLLHATSKAPSQPRIESTRPSCTGTSCCCARRPPARVSSRLTSQVSASICAARCAVSASPMTSTRPALR
jgi:hypothetical protein